MDLKKDIIPRIWFYRLMKLFASACIVYFIWQATSTVDDYNTFFEDESNVERVDFDGLSFHRQTISRGGEEQLIRYVTVSDLSYEAAEEVRKSMLESNFGDTKMVGLQSAPSFLIRKEQRVFWQQFIYQKIFLFFGGLAGVVAIMLAIIDISSKNKGALFSKEFYRLLTGLTIGLYVFGFINQFMYGRMINFLNTEFSLSESLFRGFANWYIFLGLGLTFLLIALQKAIPNQQEQELTV